MYMLALKWWQPSCHLDWCHFTFFFTVHRLIFVPVFIDKHDFHSVRSDIPERNLMHFLSSTVFFFQNPFFQKNFRTTMRMSNSLDPDQARHFVGPNLGPNCLQKLSANDTRRHIVKGNQDFIY